MKPIEHLREELKRIPKAMWEEPFDPFERPQYPPDQVETLTREDGSQVFLGGQEVLQHPPFLEQELLQPKDRAIGIGSQEGGSQQGQGIDALAWYVSFHKSSGDWGIFIPTSSLVYLELRHVNSLRLSQTAKRQVALELLLEHELFHFATDYVCAQWEVLLQAPCWRSLTQMRRDGGMTCIQLEEALANAYMLRVLEPRWSKLVQKAVRRFIRRQPPGYNQAGDYTEDTSFGTALIELTKTYIGLHAIERGLNPYSTCFDHAGLFPVHPTVPSGQCPIHIIHDLSRFSVPEISVRILKCIPEIVETEKFQKLYVQIPHDIQKRWARKKDQLKQMVPRKPEFENFQDFFSLRLGHNFRVHLRPLAGYTCWEAFEIGTHTKMGHG